MKAVHVISGRGVPLRRTDVDTDQIIPADWLKRVERTGFEKGLFSTWRDDRNFVLNDERYAGASILVAGPNFGVGSSREHAVWAIQHYGFDAVIAPRFGDIFRNNCTKNGLVPVVVPEATVEAIWTAIEADPATEITVDVERLQRRGAGGRPRRTRSRWTRRPSTASSNGLDDVGITLTHADEITAFEQHRPPGSAEASALAHSSPVSVRRQLASNSARLRSFGLLENTSIGGATSQPQRPLQDAHLSVLVVLGQRDRPAVAPGAGGAAAAVQVVLAVGRRLVVDDRADVVDVDAAGGDVGGDEHAELAVGEAPQRLLARRPGRGRRGSPSPARRDPAAIARRGRSARLVWQNTSVLATPDGDRRTTLSLSMWCTARNRWCIVPTVSVAESIATSIGSFR